MHSSRGMLTAAQPLSGQGAYLRRLDHRPMDTVSQPFWLTPAARAPS